MAAIEFPRGDGITHTFSIPQANWSSGGKLFFAAKPVIDDDNTDGNAVINQSWDDSTTTVVVINGVNYVQYACYFPPSATNGIASNGAGRADYLGEFQWVPVSGVPVTFPGTDKKLDCIVYFDVKRETS